ncbi:hypothetical protein L1987_01431 [Smallanthus sonchifolius]|uniref:Uncharacterized protein n=1 Tax=Smallanthus sonchifolius TaxID=185202 RepID=A0ACB9K520_9ASTR|nr:hypothetical protein L1987_01431 [Smallanthus sonchifolius]
MRFNHVGSVLYGVKDMVLAFWGMVRWLWFGPSCMANGVKVKETIVVDFGHTKVHVFMGDFSLNFPFCFVHTLFYMEF